MLNNDSLLKNSYDVERRRKIPVGPSVGMFFEISPPNLHKMLSLLTSTLIHCWQVADGGRDEITIQRGESEKIFLACSKNVLSLLLIDLIRKSEIKLVYNAAVNQKLLTRNGLCLSQGKNTNSQG